MFYIVLLYVYIYIIYIYGTPEMSTYMVSPQYPPLLRKQCLLQSFVSIFAHDFSVSWLFLIPNLHKLIVFFSFLFFTTSFSPPRAVQVKIMCQKKTETININSPILTNLFLEPRTKIAQKVLGIILVLGSKKTFSSEPIFSPRLSVQSWLLVPGKS